MGALIAGWFADQRPCESYITFKTCTKIIPIAPNQALWLPSSILHPQCQQIRKFSQAPDWVLGWIWVGNSLREIQKRCKKSLSSFRDKLQSPHHFPSTFTVHDIFFFLPEKTFFFFFTVFLIPSALASKYLNGELAQWRACKLWDLSIIGQVKNLLFFCVNWGMFRECDGSRYWKIKEEKIKLDKRDAEGGGAESSTLTCKKESEIEIKRKESASVVIQEQYYYYAHNFTACKRTRKSVRSRQFWR